VISVAGIRQDLSFASDFSPCTGQPAASNWGKVDFVGPWDAYSTIGSNGYAGPESGYCGTSGSAPYVAGVALLVRAYGPYLSPSSVRYQMAQTAYHVPGGAPDHYGAGVPRADWALGFTPPGYTSASVVNQKPKLTWNAVPLATEYRIYRRVTPNLAPEWVYWATRTTTSYTDNTTTVSSFFGWNSHSATQTQVSYYVVAYREGLETGYTGYATFIPVGTPPF